MQELKALGRVLKRKVNSIPIGVRYWLFFKRHILEKEEVRSALDGVELDREAFRELVWDKAPPDRYGPASCCSNRGRRWGASQERSCRDMLAAIYPYYLSLLHPASPIRVAPSAIDGAGLGLFVRRGTTVGEGDTLFASHLWGIVQEVCAEEGDVLKDEQPRYPSLYDFTRPAAFKGHNSGSSSAPSGPITAIMCGPLALANHSCGSALKFSGPRLVRCLDEFEGLQAVHAHAVRPRRVRAGEEILVDYFADGVQSRRWFACCCQPCVARRKREEQEEEKGTGPEDERLEIAEEDDRKKRRRRRREQEVSRVDHRASVNGTTSSSRRSRSQPKEEDRKHGPGRGPIRDQGGTKRKHGACDE